MAYHPGRGLIDCFRRAGRFKGGRISCVGEPERRFEEDAPHPARCSVFRRPDFSIAPETHSAMEKALPAA